MVRLKVGDWLMLKYLNGLINNMIPGEKTLSITISDNENGQPLLQNVNIMADLYRKHVSCVYFIGGEQDQLELAECCKIVHSYKLKTAFRSETEPSKLNKSLTAELDYIKMKQGGVLKKDYCPFGDIEDWIDV